MNIFTRIYHRDTSSVQNTFPGRTYANAKIIYKMFFLEGERNQSNTGSPQAIGNVNQLSNRLPLRLAFLIKIL